MNRDINIDTQDDCPPSDVGDNDQRFWAALAYLVPFAAPAHLLLKRGTSRFARRHAVNAINTQLTAAAAIAAGFGGSRLIGSPASEGSELFADVTRAILWIYLVAAVVMAIQASRRRVVRSPLAIQFIDRESTPRLRSVARWPWLLRILVVVLLAVVVSPRLWTVFKDSYSPGISGENQTDESGTLILDPRAYGVELSDPALECPGADCWPQDSLVREMLSVDDSYGPTAPASGSRMLVVRLPYPYQIRRDGVVVVKRVDVVPESGDPSLCRWVAVAFQTGDSVEMQEGTTEVVLVESGVVHTDARATNDVPCEVPPTES